MPRAPATQAKSLFDDHSGSALQAKEKAQFIAFGPVVFQVTLALRDLGVLSAVEAAREQGLGFEELRRQVRLGEYGLKVLVEGGLAIGLLERRGERLVLAKTGYFVLQDRMTQVNLDFVNDVWFRGLPALTDSVRDGAPRGLKAFGDWPTIYQGLSALPEKARTSWLAFDHFYSDDAFDLVLPLLFTPPAKRLLDLGGNTGRFAAKVLAYDPGVRVTIVDLPQQIGLAKQSLGTVPERLEFFPADLLTPDVALPKGFDVIWMSQFLDCFSEPQIVNILKACARVMDAGARLFVLEPLTDRQRFAASAFVVHLTSLYFTNMANGDSRMYSSAELTRLIQAAGLRVEAVTSGLGICQSLIEVRK